MQAPERSWGHAVGNAAERLLEILLLALGWYVSQNAFAGCSWGPLIQTIPGPVALAGRTKLQLDRPLTTPGRKRMLCLELPQGYDVDLDRRDLVSPTGERGTLRAHLKSGEGRWFTADQLSRSLHRVCLWSMDLTGLMDRSFVEVELESGLTWESAGGVWYSGDKL